MGHSFDLRIVSVESLLSYRSSASPLFLLEVYTISFTMAKNVDGPNPHRCRNECPPKSTLIGLTNAQALLKRHAWPFGPLPVLGSRRPPLTTSPGLAAKALPDSQTR